MMPSDRLQNLRENTLVEIPRGQDEVLRVTHTKADAGEKPVQWHSIRVFYRSTEGDWKPGKQGVTVRAKELKSVLLALGHGEPDWKPLGANQHQQELSQYDTRIVLDRDRPAEDDIPF